MAGSLVDFSTPDLAIPDQIVVDSNVIIDWLRASFEASGGAPIVELRQRRAVDFFRRIRESEAIGIVTSISFNEVFHFLVKARFRSEIPSHLADLSMMYPNVSGYDWFHLYKARGDLMAEFVDQFDEWRQTLVASG
jgi:hypothetical protein